MDVIDITVHPINKYSFFSAVILYVQENFLSYLRWKEWFSFVRGPYSMYPDFEEWHGWLSRVSATYLNASGFMTGGADGFHDILWAKAPINPLTFLPKGHGNFFSIVQSAVAPPFKAGSKDREKNNIGL